MKKKEGGGLISAENLQKKRIDTCQIEAIFNEALLDYVQTVFCLVREESASQLIPQRLNVSTSTTRPVESNRTCLYLTHNRETG